MFSVRRRTNCSGGILTIARATQRPQQSKEQTKLIAQGIQKGIDHYKKQQKTKAREQNKRRKQEQRQAALSSAAIEVNASQQVDSQSKLAWILLALTWLGIAVYIVS